MNKYFCTIRVKGQTVRTVVFAQSTTHARLMIEYVFGMTSVVGHPVLAEATSPTTPEQQRLATLRATKERAAVALDAERKRQQAARAQKAMAAASQPARKACYPQHAVATSGVSCNTTPAPNHPPK